MFHQRDPHTVSEKRVRESLYEKRVHPQMRIKLASSKTQPKASKNYIVIFQVGTYGSDNEEKALRREHFITKMNNTLMKLLSEVQTPAQLFHFVLSRE